MSPSLPIPLTLRTQSTPHHPSFNPLPSTPMSPSFPSPLPSAHNPRLTTPPLIRYHLRLCLLLFHSTHHPRLTTPPLIRYHLRLGLPLSPSPSPSALNLRLITPPLTRYHLRLCLLLSPSPHPPHSIHASPPLL